MVEKQFQTNIFSFVWKLSIVSEDLIVIGSWFQIVGVATEKARLPIFSLVLVTKSYLETDDLMVLDISEKCSRLTKYVSCWVDRVWYNSSQFKLNLAYNWKPM